MMSMFSRESNRSATAPDQSAGLRQLPDLLDSAGGGTTALDAAVPLPDAKTAGTFQSVGTCLPPVPATGDDRGSAQPIAPLRESGTHPDLVGLIPEQADNLRDTIIAFDKFLAPDDSDNRSRKSSPNTGMLLSLPELEQRLEELADINGATWPDVHWATEIATKVVQTQDNLRSCIRAQEPGELRHSIKELRDLITQRYPSLCGAQRGGGGKK